MNNDQVRAAAGDVARALLDLDCDPKKEKLV